MTHICNSCLKNNKLLYKSYIIENINIDEFEDIFDKYINIHNQKFVIYYIDCQFGIEYKDYAFAKIEINQHFNTDYINIKNYLLFYIDSCRYGNFVFDKIIKMDIIMISCRCNMTYNYYMNSPMSIIERYINMNLSKNPQLIKSLNIKDKHPITRQCDFLLLNK